MREDDREVLVERLKSPRFQEILYRQALERINNSEDPEQIKNALEEGVMDIVRKNGLHVTFNEIIEDPEIIKIFDTSPYFKRFVLKDITPKENKEEAQVTHHVIEDAEVRKALEVYLASKQNQEDLYKNALGRLSGASSSNKDELQTAIEGAMRAVLRANKWQVSILNIINEPSLRKILNKSAQLSILTPEGYEKWKPSQAQAGALPVSPHVMSATPPLSDVASPPPGVIPPRPRRTSSASSEQSNFAPISFSHPAAVASEKIEEQPEEGDYLSAKDLHKMTQEALRRNSMWGQPKEKGREKEEEESVHKKEGPGQPGKK